jgi:hypothetical protein
MGKLGYCNTVAVILFNSGSVRPERVNNDISQGTDRFTTHTTTFFPIGEKVFLCLFTDEKDLE